jgi:hypothetical protein
MSTIFCESIAPIDEHNILLIYLLNWWAHYSTNLSLQLTNILLGQLGKSLIVLIFCESFSTIDEHNIGSIRKIINRINILQIYLLNWWAHYSTNQLLRLTNIILGQFVKSLIVSIFCESFSTIDEHNIGSIREIINRINILLIYLLNWWAHYSTNLSLQLTNIILGQLGKSLIVSIFC